MRDRPVYFQISQEGEPVLNIIRMRSDAGMTIQAKRELVVQLEDHIIIYLHPGEVALLTDALRKQERDPKGDPIRIDLEDLSFS